MDAENIRNNAGREPADTPEASALAAAIARLPATVRWIVILGGRDGLSPMEIANLAGVRIELVELMQCRGLALIKDSLLTGLGEAS